MKKPVIEIAARSQLKPTDILHHSQLAVGAGSPTASKLADTLNKPAPTHEKTRDRHCCKISVKTDFSYETLVSNPFGLSESRYYLTTD
jgi:hypothetical protein